MPMAKKPMSEGRWLDGLDPEPMLEALHGQISPRKLRLIACAACRYVWSYLGDERTRNAVEVAERFADGMESAETLAHASPESQGVFSDMDMAGSQFLFATSAVNCACWADGSDLYEVVKRCLVAAVHVGVYQAGRDVDSGKIPNPPNWEMLVKKREKGRMARLVREVAGNPFKPIAFAAQWQTDSVRAIASTAYAERRFELLPDLATSLEAAGCKNKLILEHCRDPRPHYRGCWAVDLVLGKS
jgi:hypothetical protein